MEEIEGDDDKQGNYNLTLENAEIGYIVVPWTRFSSNLME
jgi:hypothetical protein